MVRIIIVSQSFLPVVGGMQYELKWFLDNLDRRLRHQNGIEVHFVYPTNESEPFSRFENIATHNLELHDNRRSTVAKTLIRLAGLFRKLKPDVVHCHGLVPLGTWVTVASRTMWNRPKIIVTSHGGDIVKLPQWHYGGRETVRSKIQARQTARRLTAHILPSRAMVEHATSSGVDESKLIVIPNGIPQGDDYNFEDRLAMQAPHLDPHERPPNHSDGINFLTLSSGRAVKNLGTLANAFHRAKYRLGQSRLLVACEGPRADEIQRQIADKCLQKVVLLSGQVTGFKKRVYFENSHVYCNVSHFESFGITLLEAMKYKTAVLASNVGGIPELVEHERNGLLVSPTDVSGIAEALVRLYRDTDLRKRLVEQAQKDVKQYSNFPRHRRAFGPVRTRGRLNRNLRTRPQDMHELVVPPGTSVTPA